MKYLPTILALSGTLILLGISSLSSASLDVLLPAILYFVLLNHLERISDKDCNDDKQN